MLPRTVSFVDFINSDSDRLSICQAARAIICDNDVESIAARSLEASVGVQLNSPLRRHGLLRRQVRRLSCRSAYLLADRYQLLLL